MGGASWSLTWKLSRREAVGSNDGLGGLWRNEMWLLIDDERNLNTEAVARTAEAGRMTWAQAFDLE